MVTVKICFICTVTMRLAALEVFYGNKIFSELTKSHFDTSLIQITFSLNKNDGLVDILQTVEVKPFRAEALPAYNLAGYSFKSKPQLWQSMRNHFGLADCNLMHLKSSRIIRPGMIQ